VLKNDNKFNFNKNIFLNSNDVNLLKIESDLSGFGNVKINLEIIGNINFKYEKLINAKNVGNKIYVVYNGLLSKNNYISDIVTTLYNNNQYYNDNIVDNNLCNINDKNNEFLYSYIYRSDEELFLTDGDLLVALGDNVQEACMLSSSDSNCFYRIVFVKNGEVILKIFDSNFNLKNEIKMESISYLNLKELKSISSNNSLNYFWAKSQDGYWYLIGIDNLGEVFFTRQYIKCDDIFSYFYNGVHYVLEKNKHGIVLSKFNDIELKNNLKNVEFKNVENAFIVNDVLYLLAGDVVQEIEL
jgi:hypothetical protein